MGRRGPYRTRALLRLGTVIEAAAVMLVTVLLAGCASGTVPLAAPSKAPASTPTPTGQPPAGVLIRVIPDQTTVKAGERIPATVRIENMTGHDVQFSDHACDGNVVPGIANETIPLEAAWAAAACASWSLPPAGVEYRAELATTYLSCSSSHSGASARLPSCTRAGRLPALPAGVYQTSAVWDRIDAEVALVDPVKITLTH